MSASDPPDVLSARRTIRRALQLTPVTPIPLFPVAAIVPATCVPWLPDAARVAVAGADEVVADHVVGEAVVIVVDAVARRLPGVVPDVRGEVRMVVGDALVDDRDERVIARLEIPGLRGVDGVHPPELVELRIVRHGRLRRPPAIGLGEGHRRVAL